MCGGGGSKKPSTPPAGPVVGYSYSPSDMSNQQKAALAVAPNAGAQSSYGSELSAAPAPTPTNGGM